MLTLLLLRCPERLHHSQVNEKYFKKYLSGRNTILLLIRTSCIKDWLKATVNVLDKDMDIIFTSILLREELITFYGKDQAFKLFQVWNQFGLVFWNISLQLSIKCVISNKKLLFLMEGEIHHFYADEDGDTPSRRVKNYLEVVKVSPCLGKASKWKKRF